MGFGVAWAWLGLGGAPQVKRGRSWSASWRGGVARVGRKFPGSRLKKFLSEDTHHEFTMDPNNPSRIELQKALLYWIALCILLFRVTRVENTRIISELRNITALDGRDKVTYCEINDERPLT